MSYFYFILKTQYNDYLDKIFNTNSKVKKIRTNQVSHICKNYYSLLLQHNNIVILETQKKDKLEKKIYSYIPITEDIKFFKDEDIYFFRTRKEDIKSVIKILLDITGFIPK